MTRSIYTPGEYEAQQCLFLAWSPDAAKEGMPYSQVTLAIIRSLADKYPIKLLYSQNDQKQLILSMFKKANVSISNLDLVYLPSSTIWIRDTGPSFVKLENGNFEARTFGFNEWGYGDESPENESDWDYTLAERLAQKLGLKNQQVDMISEGGNRITDGAGTFILVKEVEKKRNPNKSTKELEKILLESLGAKKVIWLSKGLCEDRMTTGKKMPDEDGLPTYHTPLTPGGHIDEFCQFASAETILLAEVQDNEMHPLSQKNAKRLNEYYELLSQETNLQGKRFNILRVPTGPLLYDRFFPSDTFFSYFLSIGIYPDEEKTNPNYPVILSTSYLNFLVMNDVILIAQYSSEQSPEALKDRDMKARKAFTKAFPSRVIKGIDPRNVNIAGGGLHCMTLTQPN